MPRAATSVATSEDTGPVATQQPQPEVQPDTKADSTTRAVQKRPSQTKLHSLFGGSNSPRGSSQPGISKGYSLRAVVQRVQAAKKLYRFEQFRVQAPTREEKNHRLKTITIN